MGHSQTIIKKIVSKIPAKRRIALAELRDALAEPAIQRGIYIVPKSDLLIGSGVACVAMENIENLCLI